MSTFISRFDTAGPGIRLAVKDLIDMAGEPTTAGCRAVVAHASPADVDAACLAGARSAGTRIVGRTNLNELAFGVTGINPWFGTPVNPLDADLAPGGSSSGSAVAVAGGDADVAYGTDTGGSIRIPSACCGTAGLKTTWGRVPLDGIRPLAPALDTVGPMARDVAGLVCGMELLEPGFRPESPTGDLTIGRVPIEAAPGLVAALDRAVQLSGWASRVLPLAGWEEATRQGALLLVAEAWRSNAGLVAEDPDGIGPEVLARLLVGSSVQERPERRARSFQRAWQATLERAFEQVDLVVTPTLTIFPPRLEEAETLLEARCTLPVNLAGLPAVVLPVPVPGGLPTSIQLIGPWGGEERLLGAAAWLEAALAAA